MDNIRLERHSLPKERITLPPLAGGYGNEIVMFFEAFDSWLEEVAVHDDSVQFERMTKLREGVDYAA